MADNDFQQFRKWYEKTYGIWQSGFLNPRNYQQMPEYLYWIENGQPTVSPKPTQEPKPFDPASRFADVSFMAGQEQPWGVQPQTPVPTAEDVAPTPEEALPTDGTEQYTYSIENIGGFKYLFMTDSKGVKTMADPTPLGEAGPSREALAYQEAASRERASAMWAGTQAGRQDQTELANQFEQMRQEMISTLTASPRNWVALSRAEKMANPYEQQPMNADEELAALQSEADLITASEKSIRARMKDPNDPLTESGVGNPQTTEEQMASVVLHASNQINSQISEMNLARAAGISKALGNPIDVPPEILNKYPEQVEAGVWSQPRAEGGGFAVGKPEEPSEAVSDMPEIPDWLASLSGVKGNVPKKRTAITTPSAQQWTALTPTKQQMYAGLVDWAGERTYEDILTGMQQQLPTPGTATKQWKATTQRV